MLALLDSVLSRRNGQMYPLTPVRGLLRSGPGGPRAWASRSGVHDAGLPCHPKNHDLMERGTWKREGGKRNIILLSLLKHCQPLSGRPDLPLPVGRASFSLMSFILLRVGTGEAPLSGKAHKNKKPPMFLVSHPEAHLPCPPGTLS